MLSTTIPTLRGWPAIAPCLEALLPQVQAVSGEIVVADGSAGGRWPHHDPHVVWDVHPGLGIFDLRRRALDRAQGSIVAVTEDHCVVAPDWCHAILAGHRAQPHCLAIKGVVTNGSPAHPLDRAAFLMNQLPHLPPLEAGPFADVVGISCASFTREALDLARVRCGATPPELAGRWLPPGRIGFDERIRAAHVQAESTWETLALQFHNARAIVGRRDRPRTSRDAWRLVAAPVLPWARAVRLARACWTRDVPRREVLTCLPLFVPLLYAKAAGEVTGYLAGAGDSGRRLQ